jgi:type III secretion protein R
MTPDSLPNPVVMVIILGSLSLAPFVLVMLTSFVKMSVVLSILRNALGTQNVPPNQVITGLAFVLTLFVMTPVVKQMYAAAGSVSNTKDMFSEASVKSVFEAIGRGREPLQRFLIKHAHNEDRALFVDLAKRMQESADENHPHPAIVSPSSQPAQSVPASNIPTASVTVASVSSGSSTNASATTSPAPAANVAAPAESNSEPQLSKDDFQVIIPAFVTSQLKEAFEIGFLIFIPFVIIDMVIANILLAMGMSMLSPSVISLPFKLLLFVLVDGWFLLVRGLVLSYV